MLLWRHERMPVPAALLGDNNLIERLGLLLQDAERGSSELYARTRRIAGLYLSPTSESPGGRKPDRDAVAKLAEAVDPRPAYWARLERHFYTLLDGLPDDWDRQRNDWKPGDQQRATDAWRRQVKRKAESALRESIRVLGTTGRAIQAVARVRTRFTDDDLKPRPQAAANAGKKGGRKK